MNEGLSNDRVLIFFKHITAVSVLFLLITAVGFVAPQNVPAQSNFRLSPQSVASPELHNNWDYSELRPSSNNGNVYRLVAEKIPVPAKMPPPVTVLQPVAPPVDNPPQTVQPAQSPRNAPFLNLANNLRHELRPANDRKWSQNHAVLQTATVSGNRVIIHNVRYSRYNSDKDYTTDYYDAAFNLDDIRTIDLVMVPFRGMPRVAHVESSFGFADGRHIGMSIEARYEADEKYDPLGAFLRQFELVYIFADERDMIRLGTDVFKNDVYVYRLKFTPDEVRMMFLDALNRANQLASKPEFYHPLTNSCVTNLLTHINKARPHAVPMDFKTVVPGLLDRYMYDLKLVDFAAPTFKDTREQAKVNRYVEKFGDLEYFSAGIRQNMLR